MPSAAIRSVAYDPARNELTVTFTAGRGYIYSLVPPAAYEALCAAGSKGSFVNQHIRDRYPFRRISAAVGSPLAEALRDSTTDD